ncbi:hypothetical protein [Rahnella victoriana]|uniref:hypothetical protein n=1 Tax=Rahnella victoriana TaxID=1510570 RepID=UPI000F4EE4A2|nr:hypothetical protein [Rahnella victoriana]
MLAEQIVQLIGWIGVILFIPTLYRFTYAASGLLWRKIFPTRKLEITLIDEKTSISQTVIVKMNRKDGRSMVRILDDALEQAKAKS